MSHYCTTKFAVRGFTESLRAEMAAAGHGVGVTVVHPGGVKTKIADNAFANARTLGLPVTDDDDRRRRYYNEKLLRLSPDKAADIIIAGVEAGRGRILVGNDAKAVDLLVRMAPRLVTRLAQLVERGR